MPNYEKTDKDWKEKVLEASTTSLSAAEAAAKLGIKFTTYKRYALKYGCYVTNKPGTGKSKNKPKIPLQEILEGKYPEFQTNKLRIRLLEEGVFTAVCSSCTLQEWLGNQIPLELDHIDGNSRNHKLDNLRLLCPNCHALTPTYRGRNK